MNLQREIARELRGHTTKPNKEAVTGCIVPPIRNLHITASNRMKKRFAFSPGEIEQHNIND